ncbi:hypothetical protein [Actinomadura rudentiformis]|uniref:DUF4337 domain-containing protein n=1 Tax=Actinomadura rudentiformis TaxID=359158 RepID=A0A6H9YH48_9ACTN|nr:hypothetical protein [Actinomadura rudentiformis]KAB2341529.1 DUF4337 domain-containing protein [Actinomadura rudentiformis]
MPGDIKRTLAESGPEPPNVPGGPLFGSTVHLMSWDIASRIFIAVVGLVGVIWQIQRTHGGTWKSIKDELEIYSLLPDNSHAKEILLKRAEAAIMQHVEDEKELRRDPFGIVLALTFLTIGATIAALAFRGGWWLASLLPAAFFVVFGIAGLNLDAVPRQRDEKGRVIKN